MTLLVTLLIIASLSFINACYSYLFQFTLRIGAILGWWLPYLARTVVKLKSRAKYAEVQEKFLQHLQMKPDTEEDYFIDECQGNFIYHLAGGCYICANFWGSLVRFAILYIYINLVEWYYIIPFILLSSFFLRKIETDLE